MMYPSEHRAYARGEAIVFRKTKEEWGAFSNMAAGFPLAVPLAEGGPIDVRTAEALYQACRFPDHPDVQRQILAQASPMPAKWVSRKHARLTRTDWDAVRVSVMRWCLWLKLLQHPTTFGRLLLATEQHPIVEESARDDFWGATPRGDELVGRNVLGCLLGEVRDTLRAALARGTWGDLRAEPPAGTALLGRAVAAYQPGARWNDWCQTVAATLAPARIEPELPWQEGLSTAENESEHSGTAAAPSQGDLFGEGAPPTGRGRRTAGRGSRAPSRRRR